MGLDELGFSVHFNLLEIDFELLVACEAYFLVDPGDGLAKRILRTGLRTLHFLISIIRISNKNWGGIAKGKK